MKNLALTKKSYLCQKRTLKASNFGRHGNLGSHGNFGPLFQKGLLSSKRFSQKEKRIKVVEKIQIYKFSSVHFWYMIHPSEATELAKKKVRSFHEV
jgi:hypothetical protein